MSHSCPLKEDYLTNNRQELQVRNPFRKHTEDHDDIWDLLSDLTFSVAALGEAVKELREEVDFLVDELDD